MFGQPGVGGHFHVFGIAIVDLALTILAAVMIVWMSSRNDLMELTVGNVVLMSVILISISLVVHDLFCVETTLLRAVKSVVCSLKCRV